MPALLPTAFVMEIMVKKLQQKYVRLKDDMARWDELQSKLLSQFANASSIIERLQVLSESKNYGGLKFVPGLKESVVGKQMETVEMIFVSMKETMKEFQRIVSSIYKIVKDANQLLRGLTPYQLQLHIGVRPSLQECMDGLETVHAMHKSEYLLKSSIISSLTWKCSASDIIALHQVLVDQPNISRAEVQSILEVIFAESLC